MPVNSDELNLITQTINHFDIEIHTTSASGISSVDLSPPFAKMSGLKLFKGLTYCFIFING